MALKILDRKVLIISTFFGVWRKIRCLIALKMLATVSTQHYSHFYYSFDIFDRLTNCPILDIKSGTCLSGKCRIDPVWGCIEFILKQFKIVIENFTFVFKLLIKVYLFIKFIFSKKYFKIVNAFLPPVGRNRNKIELPVNVVRSRPPNCSLQLDQLWSARSNDRLPSRLEQCSNLLSARCTRSTKIG
jgi:hypothetical protein